MGNFCGIFCNPQYPGECDTARGFTCKPYGSTGICTYDNAQGEFWLSAAQKKIINWFLKPFSLNGNVEAILNISILTSNPVKLCFLCFFFCENFVSRCAHRGCKTVLKDFEFTFELFKMLYWESQI